MNIVTNKEDFVIPSYTGDIDEVESFDVQKGRSFMCDAKTFINLSPISIQDKDDVINENVCIFILPYKQSREVKYTLYCYTFNDLKKLLLSSPPLFKYIPPGNKMYGDNTGPDHSFPLLKIAKNSDQGASGVNIRCNYFFLLRYNTFLLCNPVEIPIGSVFGVGSLHGAVEMVYDVRPISKREFLETKVIDYLELNKKFANFTKEDYTPGNFPPYKTEMIYESDLIRERERNSGDTAIENIFKNDGNFSINVYDKRENRSLSFFTVQIGYSRESSGYYSNERKFTGGMVSNMNVKDTEVKVNKKGHTYDILVTRGGEKILHEYLSPWNVKDYENETEYNDIMGENEEKNNEYKYKDVETSELERLCISSNSVVQKRFMVDELIWRDGEKEESKYFKDNKVYIPNNIPLQDEFKDFYPNEVSLIMQCRRKGVIWESSEISKEGNLRLLKYHHENGFDWDNWVCRYAAENGHLECLKYAHENGCEWNENTCAVAAYNGHLECLKYAHEKGCGWNEKTCSFAAMNGHLECLKYAHEKGCSWDKNTCWYAAKNGYLECLKYAHENGCPWDEWTCYYAAFNGRLECLKYAHENGCPWDKTTCNDSAGNGKLDCLKYAVDNECPGYEINTGFNLPTEELEELCISSKSVVKSKYIIDELIWRDGENEESKYFKDNKVFIPNNIPLQEKFKRYLSYHINGISLIAQCRRVNVDLNCEEIAREGNLRLLEYAHEKGIEWDEKTFSAASENGHLMCLNYAIENDCPCDEDSPWRAAKGGHLEVLIFLHKNECPWDYRTCAYAAKYGHLECLKYARENGCEWNETTPTLAAEKGHLECLKYAVENGCATTEDTSAAAAENGQLDCLMYLHKKGCPWDKYTCSLAARKGHFDCLKYAIDNGCPEN